MAYDPSLYYPGMYQSPVNAVTTVFGIDGAKAYQLPPNSSTALFDSDDDVFYYKTTDGAGFPTIRKFRFEEIIETPEVPSSAAVSREEFDALSAKIDMLVSSMGKEVTEDAE